MTHEQFTRAVGTHADTVYRVALHYTYSPSAAEDVVQEVFLRLFRSGKDFDSEDHLRFWLIRVCINECKRIHRSPWSRLQPLPSAETLGVTAPHKSELFYAVMALPRKYRLAIHLHYYEGYKTKEIAELLKIPESTVRTQLERGRKTLKQTLLEADNV